MQIGVRDAARLLNVSEKTIYRWLKQETIPAYKINEQFRFNRAELLEWATSQRIQISPEIFAEDDASAPLPTLAQAVAAGGIHYRVGGGDKSGVLQSIVGLMNLPEEVDRAFLYQVLLAREALGSTALGDGIAIPHVRNPIVLHVNKPLVTLSFLESPVDFGALDGKPVSVLFTLVSPTVRAHLHVLSRLGFMLRHDGLREGLKSQAPREQLMSLLEQAETCIPSATPATGP